MLQWGNGLCAMKVFTDSNLPAWIKNVNVKLI